MDGDIYGFNESRRCVELCQLRNYLASDNSLLPHVREQISYFINSEIEYLRFAEAKNHKILMQLFISTGFIEEIDVNLSFLYGLKGKELKNEINIINEKYKNKDELTQNPEIYFLELLRNEIVDFNELFFLIMIHEQRHYFSFPPELQNTCKSIIQQLSTNFYETQNIENIDNIAVLGTTYEVQKKRLCNGMKFYYERKNKNPKNIFFATGSRHCYLIELVQLGIINEENFNSLKQITGTNDLNGIISYIQNNKQENNWDEYFNKQRLSNVLNNIKDVSPKFREITNRMNFTENDDLLLLLENIAKVQERDLFLLAINELDINPQTVKIIYTLDTNGAGVLSSQRSIRASTEDTIRELCKQLKILGISINSILFVSNNQFVAQQYKDIVFVVQQNGEKTSDIQIYGENGNNGSTGNIAARHNKTAYILLCGEKELDFISTSINNSIVKKLGNNLQEAYAEGQRIRQLELEKRKRQQIILYNNEYNNEIEAKKLFERLCSLCIDLGPSVFVKK